jgi:beta-galactosidase
MEKLKMNVGCDFVNPVSNNLENYSLLIVPALYSAPDSLLERLNTYVKNGGHIVYSSSNEESIGAYTKR